MRNRRRTGNFIGFIVGLLFGIFVTLGGLAGGGYIAYKKVKVRQIPGGFFGEEFGEMTISQAVGEISGIFKGDMTIARLEGYFPKIGSILPADGIDLGGFARLDVAALKDLPLNRISSEFSSALEITATLGTLQQNLGVQMPNIPFIQGGPEGSEVWTYVPATDEVTIEAEAGGEEGEETDGPEAVSEEEREEEGTEIVRYRLKSTIGEEEVLYKKQFIPGEEDRPTEDFEYVAIDRSELEERDGRSYYTEPLWYMANGLMDVNVLDAFNVLSSALDMDRMTFGDLEEKFGIDMKKADGSYHPVLEQLLDKKVRELGSVMDETVQELYLADLLTIGEDDKYLAAIAYKRGANGELLGVYAQEGEEPIEVAIDDATHIPLDDRYGTEPLERAKVKVKGINDQINNVRLKDLIAYDASNKIMAALGDTPVGQIGARIGALTLPEVMNVEDGGTLLALAYRRVTGSEAKTLTASESDYFSSRIVDTDLYYLGTADGATVALPVAGYRVEAEGGTASFVERDVERAVDGVVPVATPISEVGAEVDHLLLSDCVTIGPDSVNLMKVLKDTPVKDLGDKLGSLGIEEILGEETVKGYLKATDEEGNLLPTFAGAEKLYKKEGDDYVEATKEETGERYVYDYTSVWYFILGGEEEVTLSNMGESVGKISASMMNTKIGELYDRGILALKKAPEGEFRNCTLIDVIEKAESGWEVLGGRG